MAKKRKIAGMISLIALFVFPFALTAEADAATTTENSTYTVTIPSEVTIPSDTKTAPLHVSAKLASNTNLVITINSNNGFKLVNGDSTSDRGQIGYTISDVKPLVFSNHESSNADKSYDLNLTIAKRSHMYSGTYTDILTFNMSATQSEDEINHHLEFNVNAVDDTIAITTERKVLKEGEAYGTLPTPRRTGYDFEGWYKSSNPGDDDTPVTESDVMGDANVQLYAKWKIHTFRNTMTYWAWGFTQQEGNNGGGTAIRLSDDKAVDLEFKSEYASDYTFTKAMASHVDIPRGYELKQFGSATVGDSFTWRRYDFDANGSFTAKQPDWTVNAEYEYDPIRYTITYDLNGGTNDKANPPTYIVLYGVTFKDPVKEGYTFEGWYDKTTGKRITGINEDCVNDFKGISDYTAASKAFYKALENRTIGNVIVEARWTPVSED